MEYFTSLGFAVPSNFYLRVLAARPPAAGYSDTPHCQKLSASADRDHRQSGEGNSVRPRWSGRSHAGSPEPSCSD